MAIIALFAVGSLIGGYLGGGLAIAATIGGMVGGLAGGYIDSQYTFPALFGKDSSVVGPRMGDFSIQTASEGSALKRVYGINNKVAGTVIWMGELIEKKHTEHHDGGKGGPSITSTTYTYFIHLAIAICAGPIDGPYIQNIYADAKKIFSYAEGKDHRSKSITLYAGDVTQTPNSLMESVEGVGNVPGYVGTCMAVIEEFALADFGNRVPNFQFDVPRTLSNDHVGTVIGLILEDAGFLPEHYDVSALPIDLFNEEELWVRGFVIGSPMQARAPIETLMACYNLYPQNKEGVLCFFKRGQEDVVEIPSWQLAARTGDEKPPRPVTVTDTPGFELPAEATVAYLDIDTHLQTGLQRARRTQFVVDSLNSVDFPIAMSATAARKIAERRLWTAWAERESLSVSLPPSFLHLLEGDAILVPDGDELYTARVTTIERGANYLHQVKAVKTQSQSNDAENATGEGGVYNEPTLYVPPDVLLALIDGPALREEDIHSLRLYWALCAEDPDATWIGGSLWDSADDATFTLVGAVALEGSIGTAVDELLVGSALSELWDEENSVEVVLANGSLSSVTEEECLAGANRMFVGDELIGFREVEDLGSNHYRLSGLIRGLRDTPMDTHAADERVVGLSPTAALQAVNYPSSQVGVTRHYRGAAVGADVLALTSTDLELRGGTARCFSPAHPTAALDAGTGDWTIEWVRRTRAWTRLFQETPVPMEEAVEKYEIDVMDGSDVVRTSIVLGSPTATYTSAQQTADFGSPQTSVTVRIYQIGALLGRGRMTEVTF